MVTFKHLLLAVISILIHASQVLLVPSKKDIPLIKLSPSLVSLTFMISVRQIYADQEIPVLLKIGNRCLLDWLDDVSIVT